MAAFSCETQFRKNSNERLASEGIIEYKKPEWLEKYRVLANDASDVCEKGRSGRVYRLHFSLDLFKMQSAEQIITTQKTGEALTNFTFRKNDLVIGDRIYSTFKGINHCLECEADFVLRLRKNSFSLYDANGENLDLLEKLQAISDNEVLDQPILVKLDGKEMTALRVCAKRKPEAYRKQNDKKLRRRETRHQIEISSQAKEFNNFIVVVTNLPEAITAEQILELYKMRWQIEIYFKRLKSILDFGELPKRRENGALAWLNGKIMVALLIERFLSRQIFSPVQKLPTQHLA